ncbi:MAG: J domain-containing protein [Dehalococcoidia bacterium]|nr:J domain-containing protein [Dehalococcoidia bacterium]
MAKDYYIILGVTRDASDKDVRQAYRGLARKYHPDVNKKDKDAEERFKEINAAYEVISDPEKRKKYDQFGENWKYADRFASAGDSAPSGPFYRQRSGAGGSTFDLGDLRDMGFGDLFGDVRTGQRRSGRRTVIQDTPVEVPVEVSLEEAYAGVTRIVQIPASVAGQARRLEVQIPPGVDTASRVHVSIGSGAELYLVVAVKPHHRFTRKGADLYVDLPVSLVDAILGCEQDVQTMKGKLVLTLPHESQNGQVFRLRGQGMPRLDDPTSLGDLFVALKVVLPTNLTERERQLFEELSTSRGGRSAKQ